MHEHRVTGGGGVQLHVSETGNSSGPAILFVHGLSQCGLTWRRQMHSDLADSCRLVSMDLRGHGRSGRPRDAYGDSTLWADDVRAVIEGLKLERPILTGWSYGPLVILDYVRKYGESNLGGIHFVGGVSKLGTPDAADVLTPRFLELVPGLLSSDAEKSTRALEGLIRLCLSADPGPEELYLSLGYSVSVPPYVRHGLLTRTLDNEDLLRRFKRPVLITHGTSDAVVTTGAVDYHKACMPHAEVDLVPDGSHAVFFEQPARFNERLRAFATAAVGAPAV